MMESRNLNIKMPKRVTCFECDNSTCHDQNLVKYCTNALKCWKFKGRNEEGQIKVERGCHQSPEELNICMVNRTLVNKNYVMDCCADEYCNNGDFPDLPLLDKVIQDEYDYLMKVRLAVFESVFLLGISVFLVVLVLLSVYLCVRQKRKKKLLAARSLSFDLDEVYDGDALFKTTATVGDSTLKEYLEQSITSGSGFGLPLLSQRTLAKQISLKLLVGKGKYGEVWWGLKNDVNVAVKIFLSKDEASWARETEIYNTVLTQHPNILNYIGSDMTSNHAASTQLWLVTDYHAQGSLYDYLNRYTLNYTQMYKFMFSIVKGINHLHEEKFGVEDKPFIAHRDIKSKNILVKEDGECVIADFGLAVTYYQQTNQIITSPNPRVGTKRYMAPEVLDQILNTRAFESYKRADIYSLGLVFWEICWRTTSNGIVEEYKPPFYDCVGADPSFDEMRKIVCTDRRRPLIPNRWASDSVLQFIIKITKECWHQKATVRPSCLRIRKTLQKLNL